MPRPYKNAGVFGAFLKKNFLRFFLLLHRGDFAAFAAGGAGREGRAQEVVLLT
jgi:hypothetical protein